MRKLIVVLTGTGILIWLHLKGFVPYDEGWFIQAGYRFFTGEKPYADFSYLYNPGSLYVNALAFWIFGKSILASRLMAIINALAATGIIFQLSRKWQIHYKLAVLLAGIYIFWGPGHINFVWPVMWCITTALAATLIAEKSDRTSVFGIGVLAAITFIFKQNFGLAFLIAWGLYIFINKKRDNFRAFIYGYLTIIAVQILYFIKAGILLTYLREFWYLTVERIFLGGVLNSPWIWEYDQSGGEKIIKILVYLTPLIISGTAGYKLYKENRLSELFLPMISVVYYVLSIRPTMDYIHLAPMMALAGINFGLVGKNPHKIVLAVMIGLLLTGGYSAWIRPYYRWNTPLAAQNTFVDEPRVKLFTDQTGYRSIRALSLYFAVRVPEPEIFIYNFAPMFYFILDKQNPTRYDYVHSGVISDNAQKEIINILDKKNIRIILANIDLVTDKNNISAYIQTVYRPVYTINEYTVWQRNPGLAKTFSNQLTMTGGGNR